MYKILIVEDDPILGETIEELCQEEGYETTWVKDGKIALDFIYEKQYDLFLFDVNIPFINGFDLLEELRQSGDFTPTIFITANVDINSIKKGFDVGVDDYIKKPFDFDELNIRMEALIKKSFKNYDENIIYNQMQYNLKTNRLSKDGKNIHLTPTQIYLLEYFLKNIDKIVSPEELYSYSNDQFDGSIASLRVQISKLKKLGFNIQNIRGMGYRLEEV
jgi:DNA-binding response OmpR family regulator